MDIAWGLQELGLILGSKVVQKLSLEKKNIFNKKGSPKLLFLDEILIAATSIPRYIRKRATVLSQCMMTIYCEILQLLLSYVYSIISIKEQCQAMLFSLLP